MFSDEQTKLTNVRECFQSAKQRFTAAAQAAMTGASVFDPFTLLDLVDRHSGTVH